MQANEYIRAKKEIEQENKDEIPIVDTLKMNS